MIRYGGARGGLPRDLDGHILKLIKLALWLVLGMVSAASYARAPLEFTLHRNGDDPHGPTILVIGGIQGDEPGGFNAASLLVTNYDLNVGNVWVVPNLNFESIIKRTRGVYGDMNRKFPSVSPSDPDYERVEKIKSIITETDVDFVFNLHDGSGFFRTEYVDKLRNPNRWGQSIIIDQETIDADRFGGLGDIARHVSSIANLQLNDPGHVISVKNTKTREGDQEMAKTLTYFAINNGKPAVGIEASKSLPTHLRVFYHLLVLETYMDRLGLDFERSFDLTPESVKRAVDDNVQISFYDNKMFLDVSNARERIKYWPLKKGSEIEYKASSPLVAIVNSGKQFRIKYGNRNVTKLDPEFFEYDTSRGAVSMLIDDDPRDISFGSVVGVRDAFVVEPSEGYRVNVIGWRRKNVRDEAGFRIMREDIAQRFSVDTGGTTYRVEVYKGKKFSGQILVRFGDATTAYRQVKRKPS